MCVTMAARVSSQFPNLDKNEAAYAAFIKDKIEKAGGLIKFQHITGHLSQLDLCVREAIGASPIDLRKFLKKHNELFTVDSEGFVTCQKSSVPPAQNVSRNSKVDNDSSHGVESLFPAQLKEVPGVVIKVLPMYGFIAIKNPVKTSVYFTPGTVVDNTIKRSEDDKLFLTDFPDMLPGKKVLINAKKANTSLEAKYRATRVWTPADVKNEVLVPEGFSPKVPKDSMYDPESIEGSGRIQKVFDQFGFITNESTKDNIFFHKSKVLNVQNIMNLAKVFQPDDIVEFKAIRSTKKVKNVKWEATKVWLKKGKTDLFKPDPSKKDSNCDSQSDKKEKKSFHQVIENEPGKVYPHSDGIVIKFGKHEAELADADSCPFYVHGTIVNDVCWEFSDADKVTFAAVRIKSAPGWKALLAWVGERPNVPLPNINVFIDLSDDDSASVNEKIVFADNKTRVFENSAFTKKSGRNISSDRSKTFRPSSANSQVSNSRSNSRPRSSIDRDYDLRSTDRSKTFKPTSQSSNSRSNSKSRTSVDRDYDLQSEDTMSTVSGDSRTNTYTRPRRRQRRPRYNASNAIQKVSSYSSLTDDIGLESEDSYSNQDKDEFRNADVYLEEDSGTNVLSSATLKASSSFESLDLRDRLKPSSEYQNWADTPYPEEDDDQASTRGEDISSLNTDNSKQDDKLIPVKSSTEKKSSSQIQSLKEMFLDDDEEYSDAVQDNENIVDEIKSQKPAGESSKVLNSDLEHADSLMADILNETDSEKEPVSQKKPCPSVKFLVDLEGEILKVYCKYAEINNPKLVRPVSVLWSDLYHNGVPVADKFDDMKEIIKPKQTIKFNCIQIVDDEGTSWQKVTIAWRGQKPNVTEMTPQKFIKDINLTVSVPESEYDLGDHNTSSEAKKVTATQPEVPPPPKKFLTLADLCCDDEDESDPENESSSEKDEAVPQDEDETIPSLKEDLSSISPVDGEDDLEDAVVKMISSFSDAEVDVRVLSSNIINLVRSKTITQKAEDLLKSSSTSNILQYYPEGEKRPSESLSKKPKNDLKDSQTQTIITGDVIAQSIFTL